MGRHSRRRVASAVAVMGALALPASAASPRRAITNTLGAAVNPVGVQDQLELGWRWGLTQSKNPFRSDAHLALGVTNTMTPAYERLDAWAEISPLSVLDVRVGVEPMYFFGTFGHLVGFPSYDSDFSRDARIAIKDQAVARTGVRYHASPTFKIKLGRFLARSGVDFEWWRVSGPGAYYYEPSRDTLLDSQGDALTAVSTQVFYEAKSGAGSRLLAGVFHDRVDVHAAPQNRHQRLGPIAVWTLGARRLGLRDPTLIAAVVRYVEDPSKDGTLAAFVAASFALGAR
jgi:hypothetical protein